MQAYFKLSVGAWRQLRRSWPLPATFALAAQTYLSGSLNSASARLQTLLKGAQRESAPKTGAVVILGFWRSGTTLLHELLCLDERFGFPTTYACLSPHNFILTQDIILSRYRGLVQRPQDKMMIGPQSPQEDEFALLCMGARSPYEGLLAPQSFAQSFALADPDDLSPRDAKRWCAAFEQFFRGVSLVSGGKPLVLKSPAHSYRVPTLRKILPDARFILIVRNPYDVLESMLRTYKALAGKYGLAPLLPDDEVRQILLKERMRFEAKLLTGIAEIPARRFALVKYEELVADPVGVVARLYEQLDLPGFESVRPKLEAEAAQRSGYVPETTRSDSPWRRRITEAWSALFDRYGYAKDQPGDLRERPN
jgi:hypothetical protein